MADVIDERGRMGLYRIPAGLNRTLTVAIAAGLLGMQWLASHTGSSLLVFACALAFAALQIPLYTLLHESLHKLLDPNPRANYLNGMLLSTLFMGPWSFLHQTHMGHHRRNRTDAEMFDLYYPHQSRVRKTLFLWGIMVGLFWLSIPAVSLLFLVVPRGVRTRFLTAPVSAGAMLLGVQEKAVARIRLETLVMILFHGAAFWLLDLRLEPFLFLYAVHALAWSSQNYVNHAFSRRDIMNGAHNLRMGRWMQAFYLNFNCHLAHHQHPAVPWPYLPALVEDHPGRTSHLEAWFRLWRGPVLTTEPPPKSLDPAFEARMHLEG